MKRTLVAKFILIVFIVNIFISSFSIAAYSQEVPPEIDDIIIDEVVTVTNGNIESNYQVRFTGFNLANVTHIRVYKVDDDQFARKTLSHVNFKEQNDGTIIYDGTEQALIDIFGVTGDVYFGIHTVNNPGGLKEPNKIFTIPEENLMSVDTINKATPGAWPVDVIRGETFTIEGANFNVYHSDNNPEGYRLGIARRGTTPDYIEYEHVQDQQPSYLRVDTGGANIDKVNAQSGQSLYFRKESGDRVVIRYIIEESINIGQELNLGKVRISPLRGAANTILRIRADRNEYQLIDESTDVFIGGQKAERNASDFNDQGVFTYVDEDGTVRRGIEVLVPLLETPGGKQIVIRNHTGHIYIYPEDFIYEEDPGTRLRVLDIDPGKAYTNEVKEIQLSMQSAIALNNINLPTGVVIIEGGIKEGTIDGEDNTAKLRYFFNQAQSDPDSYYLMYELSNGNYVERKITLFIARRAKINSLELESYEVGGAENILAQTARVDEAGIYDVLLRTETIMYEVDGDLIEELNYVVEEAPVDYMFEFGPDRHTPTIESIKPEKGPYNQNIAAILEGQNFRVEMVDGEPLYPTIIIGTNAIQGNQKYKVITKDGFYTSSRSDGSNRIPLTGEGIPADSIFTVMDEHGNVLDGQAIRTGTTIKFTIPKLESFYNGFADVIVHNPSPIGGAGGLDRAENLFEYITPGDGYNHPEIFSVTPDRAAVGEMPQVVIQGRNFRPNSVVTIGGEVALNPNINVAQGRITITAPYGRPGKTKLQVIDPEGGFAEKDFEYVYTYSQPYIESIVPNRVGKGSLVIIKGDNFYQSDPGNLNVDYRIGTKVYVDGKDVNKEYSDELEVPTDPSPDYFVDPNTGEEVTGPDGEPIKTFGSNVAVVDNETIYLIIPDPRDVDKTFPMDIPLDVEVINPDLGKFKTANGIVIVDVAQNPTIHEISPNFGDYRGGNIIKIAGDNFRSMAEVYFGSKKAQIHGREGNSVLWVHVPRYEEELVGNEEAYVPVTVRNNDGGTATIYKGYRYVNPGYSPTIEQIYPEQGNTAGGDRVIIEGGNFRAKNFGEIDEQIPTVYFGGKQVNPENVTFSILPPKDEFDEVEISIRIIVEKTPPNSEGLVDVTVMNFDGAIATRTGGFQYISKQPEIDRVLPEKGSMRGGTDIVVDGEDFVEQGLHVVFGERNDESDFYSGYAEVNVDNLIVYYDAYASEENVTVYYGEVNDRNRLPIKVGSGDIENGSFRLSGDHEIFKVEWSKLPEELVGEASNMQADENIKVEIVGNYFRVIRSLGVVKRVIGEKRIEVVTPPYGEITQTTLTVFNSDGKSATADFEFTSPFRSPIITNVIPTIDIIDDELGPIDVVTASMQGGSPIIIQGENFREGVKVFIGLNEAEIRSISDDEIIVTAPPASDGNMERFLRIWVMNADGGIAYGDVVPDDQNRNPIYFRYMPEGSSPSIEMVKPNKGPVTGGTQVLIYGSEFRNEDEFGNPRTVDVNIGGLPVLASSINLIDDKTVEITMPEGRIGPQTIEIVNYDFGRAIGTDIFTYISQPRILSINPTQIFINDTETEITLTGRMFMPGAQVIIGGKLISEDEIGPGMTVMGTGISGVDGDGRNIEVAVVGGAEAATVEVVNESTIRIKLEENFNLDNNDIIIINPDGGVSQPYTDFNYEIPIPTKPLVLEAIPGYESTVKLIWLDSDPALLNAADRYEVYGKKANDRRYTFLGDTRDAEYLVTGLDPNANYSFKVRALNRYGSALEFAEVTVRTLSERVDPKLRDKQAQLEREAQELDQFGKEEVVGDAIVRIIGKNQIPFGFRPYVIDFSRSQYRDHNKFTVAIPVSLLNSSGRQITITDGKAAFTFSLQGLYTREVSQISWSDIGDAHMRVTLERLTGQREQALKSAVPRNQREVSHAYEISFELQVRRNITSVRRMTQSGNLELNFEQMAYPAVNKSRLFLGEYIPSRHQFRKVEDGNKVSIQEAGRFMLLTNR